MKFSGLSWTKDGSGFYYSRFAEPEAGRDLPISSTSTRRSGSTASARRKARTRKIYATPAHPKRGHGAQVTDDGKYLLVTSSEGTDDRYELHVGKLGGRGRSGSSR